MVHRRFFTIADEQGQQWPVWTDDVTIGSAPTNTLVIPEPSVAAVQTRVWRAMDRCWIRDEGALFGTLVNGEPVEGDQELHAGDIIAVGTREYRMLVEPLVPGRISADRRPVRKTVPDRGSRVPLPALLVPIALLVVVLGAAVLARRGHRQAIDVELQWVVSDDQGIASFDLEGDRQVTIEARDEYNLPLRDVQIGYLPGKDGSYQAFFALYDGVLSGAAIFPAAPSGVLRVVPNVMMQAGPDQIPAISGFLRELGYGPEAYVDTGGTEPVANLTEQADAALRLEIARDGQVFFGVQGSGPADDLRYEPRAPAVRGEWDRYLLSARDRAGGGTYAVVLYAASQHPIMTQVDRLDSGEGDEVRVSFLAIDPWTYPGPADPAYSLLDHTISLGPTADSDLEYRYRVLGEGAAVLVDWTSVLQEAVCTPGGCQPTEVGLARPPQGTYILEVYALDEVQNPSRTLQLPFAVGE